MLNILTYTGTIIDDALGYVDQGLSFVSGLPGWAQLLVFAFLAIFALVGFFVFIRKFIKVFIIVAILGGGLYYVWTQTPYLDGVKDFINGLGAFITSIHILL